jgi:hypothetical protein
MSSQLYNFSHDGNKMKVRKKIYIIEIFLIKIFELHDSQLKLKTDALCHCPDMKS